MFFDKLTKLNQSISYNLFAFNGYFIICLFAYIFLISPLYIGKDFEIIYSNIAIITVYVIVGIILYMEHLTKYKLKFAFLKSYVFLIIQFIGATISLFYLFFMIIINNLLIATYNETIHELIFNK